MMEGWSGMVSIWRCFKTPLLLEVAVAFSKCLGPGFCPFFLFVSGLVFCPSAKQMEDILKCDWQQKRIRKKKIFVSFEEFLLESQFSFIDCTAFCIFNVLKIKTLPIFGNRLFGLTVLLHSLCFALFDYSVVALIWPFLCYENFLKSGFLQFAFLLQWWNVFFDGSFWPILSRKTCLKTT